MAAEVSSVNQADGGGASSVLTPTVEVAGGVCALGFFIHGKPQPKGRPRFSRDRFGRPRTYTPEETVTWERTIGWAAREQVLKVGKEGVAVTLPFQDRVVANIVFYMPKPKSYAKSLIHNTKKPDLDNLSKAVLDALEKAGFLKNDGQVTDLSLAKRYAEVEEVPAGVRVDLTGWLT